MRVYFDNAASGFLDPEVLEVMMPYLTDFQGNPSSIHFHGRQLRSAIEKSRKTVADILNCSPAEIVFTSRWTESDNYALKSCAISQNIKHFITTQAEHHAVTHTAEFLEKYHNVKIHYLKLDSKGNIDLEELKSLLINNQDVLVSLMHGNNEIGTLHPIQSISEICKEYNAFFHSDTVQTMGHIPLDLKKTEINFVIGSAHKFYGPKGVGFLYKKEQHNMPSLICGGSQERNQRAGTENVAFIVGIAKALEKCNNNHVNHHNHLRGLKEYFMQKLIENFANIEFNGETSDEKSLATVLNVCFPSNDEDSMLLINLDLHGISASGGSACTSGSNKGSHVLQAIGLPPEKASNSIRFSFGFQNNFEEIDFTISKLKLFVPQNLASKS